MDSSIADAVLEHPTEHISWQFDCLVADRPADTFVVTAFQGQQSLSESCLNMQQQTNIDPLSPQSAQRCIGFYYQIELASDQYEMDLNALIDQPAELMIRKNEQPVQYINGVIRQFTAGSYGQHKRHYRLTLVPSLERLSLRHNLRIFQMQTAQQIMETLLKEMAITDYRFQLQAPPVQREFCVQYRQTDLDFLLFLAHEEGWIFYFEHEPGHHRLVFTDLPSHLPQIEVPILYHGQGGGVSQQLYIHQLQEHHQQLTSSTSRKDYSFKNPVQPLLASGTDARYQGRSYEYYDWGRHKSAASAKAQSQQQLHALRRDAITATGSSNHPLIQAGYRISTQDELKSWIPGLASSSVQQWSVVQAYHQGKQPQSLHAGQDEIADYHNQFTLIPAAHRWQSPPKSRPQADSLINGIVVGPAGEEIFCDEFGRVKVHFLWDRESKQDENSSPWIRVAQNWAGGKHGAITIPRIGDEVLISFLYNDPDQPIITGRAFHSINRPPRTLPDHKTQTVLFRTHTHQGEGFNELRTEDQAGEEQIYLHGQKDFVTKVLNDQLTDIGHDKELTVGNDQRVQIGNDYTHKTVHDRTTEIGNDDHLTVSHDQTLTVDHQRSHKVGKDEDIQIGNNQTNAIGGNQQLTVSKEQNIEIKQQRMLTVGEDHQIQVGGNENHRIDASCAKKIADNYSLTVGDQFELVCGESKLIMQASGKIELTGTQFVLNGGQKIVLNSKRVDLN